MDPRSIDLVNDIMTAIVLGILLSLAICVGVAWTVEGVRWGRRRYAEQLRTVKMLFFNLRGSARRHGLSPLALLRWRWRVHRVSSEIRREFGPVYDHFDDPWSATFPRWSDGWREK